PIKSIADALEAIVRIKGEGEGTPESPSQGPSDEKRLAHFYFFQMIKVGQRYISRDGKWILDTASKIQLPTVYDFRTVKTPGASTSAFSKILTDLLKSLETCWQTGAKPDIGLMASLQDAGSTLIKNGIRPEFTWST